MVIEQVSILHYGKLHDLTLQFGESINVIEGENESGKSTVFSFIRYMLYGFSAKKGAALTDRQKYISWHTARAEGSMDLHTEDGTPYRIERSTVLSETRSGRESYRETVRVLRRDTLAPVPMDRDPGEAFLGIPAALFDNIAFLSGISDEMIDGKSTSDAIENILFSGDESIDSKKALEKLEAERRRLLHKNEKGGQLYELQEKLQELQAAYEAAKDAQALLIEGEQALLKTEEELQKTEKEAEALRTAADQLRRQKLLARFAEKRKTEEALRAEEAKKEAWIQAHSINGTLPAQAELTELAVARRVCKEAGDALASLAAGHAPAANEAEQKERALCAQVQQAGGAERLRTAAAAEKKKCKLFLTLCILSLLTAGIGAVFLLPLAATALLSVLFLILSLAAGRRARALFPKVGASDYTGFLLRLKQAEDAAARFASAAEAEHRYRDTLRQAKERQETAEAAYAAQFALFGIAYEPARAEADFSSVCRQIEAGDALFREIDTAAARLRAELSLLEKQLEGADEDALRASLLPEVTATLHTQTEEKLHATLRFTEEKLRALETRYRDLKEHYIEAKAKAEDPLPLQERILQDQAKYKRLRDMHAAVLLAYEGISGAGDRLRAQIAPHLAESASKSILSITDGKYAELGVDTDLSLSCRMEKMTRSPEYLSSGTKTALYLSLRLALISLLAKEKMPLCLDESLANQDDTRAKRLMQHLTECGAKLQCFLFTCQKRDAHLAPAGTRVLRLT